MMFWNVSLSRVPDTLITLTMQALITHNLKFTKPLLVHHLMPRLDAITFLPALLPVRKLVAYQYQWSIYKKINIKLVK